MNRLSSEKRAQVVACLVEGNSIRATVRMTGVAKNTVTKLLVDLGTACSVYQDTAMRDLPCERLECDEIWAFCYSKAKNVPPKHRGEFGYGDVWTWVAIGGEEASRGLPTSAALVGPLLTPVLPDASTVDLGRWILWALALEHLQAPICMVCVELPLRYNYY